MQFLYEPGEGDRNGGAVYGVHEDAQRGCGENKIAAHRLAVYPLRRQGSSRVDGGMVGIAIFGALFAP